MIRELVKRLVAEAAPEEPTVRNIVKWIVCRNNSIGDALVCYENACFIRRGLRDGQRGC